MTYIRNSWNALLVLTAQRQAAVEALDAAALRRKASRAAVAAAMLEAQGATAARREALFASGLQPSDMVTTETVAASVDGALRRFGVGGCASLMAQEFGDHPDAAADRMRWVCRHIR